MPRANRTYLPGLVWHITHRCHNRSFLLKGDRYKREWKRWIAESRKRYKLRVLNYTLTDNHIHLLAFDKKPGSSISSSMQLTAGQTAQTFNAVHSRRGAFWEDRYHATAVQTGDHLLRCICYIDLNMARAGAVSHPSQWQWGGYRELQETRTRYRLVDSGSLMKLLGVSSVVELRDVHGRMIESSLRNEDLERDDRWSGAIAVGDDAFVRQVHERLQVRMGRCAIVGGDGVEMVGEPREDLYESPGAGNGNTFDWMLGEGPSQTHAGAADSIEQ